MPEWSRTYVGHGVADLEFDGLIPMMNGTQAARRDLGHAADLGSHGAICRTAGFGAAQQSEQKSGYSHLYWILIDAAVWNGEWPSRSRSCHAAPLSLW